MLAPWSHKHAVINPAERDNIYAKLRRLVKKSKAPNSSNMAKAKRRLNLLYLKALKRPIFWCSLIPALKRGADEFFTNLLENAARFLRGGTVAVTSRRDSSTKITANGEF